MYVIVKIFHKYPILIWGDRFETTAKFYILSKKFKRHINIILIAFLACLKVFIYLNNKRKETNIHQNELRLYELYSFCDLYLFVL